MDSGGSQASFLMQAFSLTRRSFINMSRDVGYYWLRLVIYILLTIFIGTIYFRIGTSSDSILVRDLFIFISHHVGSAKTLLFGIFFSLLFIQLMYELCQARGACASFVFGFVTFMSIGGFPSFVEDMKVIYSTPRQFQYL